MICAELLYQSLLTSADPEGVVVWKGEEFEDETLTVHLEDNDLTDPIELAFTFYSTARNNSMGESVYDVIGITKEFPDGLPGGSYTLHLNSDEWTADPGLYTFQVEATQTDICNTDPYLQITDGDIRYRSEHLSLRRGIDAMGPVYEAEYYGYDDKGTPDEDDDDFLYYIRLYQVSSSDPICGSEGEVWLYDPTLTGEYLCGLGGLECLLHPSPDGLCNGYHAIVIPVPVSAMEYGGFYRFVLHIKDDHGNLYRNGQDRWALDLNATSIKPTAIAYCHPALKRTTESWKTTLENMGYAKVGKNEGNLFGWGNWYSSPSLEEMRGPLQHPGPDEPTWSSSDLAAYNKRKADKTLQVLFYGGHGDSTTAYLLMQGKHIVPSVANPHTQRYVGPTTATYHTFPGVDQQYTLLLDTIQPTSEGSSRLSNIKLVFLVGCYMQNHTALGRTFLSLGVKCVASFGADKAAAQVESQFVNGVAGTPDRPETPGFVGYLAQGKTIREALEQAYADLSLSGIFSPYLRMGKLSDYAYAWDAVTGAEDQKLKL